MRKSHKVNLPQAALRTQQGGKDPPSHLEQQLLQADIPTSDTLETTHAHTDGHLHTFLVHPRSSNRMFATLLTFLPAITPAHAADLDIKKKNTPECGLVTLAN